MLALAEETKANGLLYLLLTGGEPFLHPRLLPCGMMPQEDAQDVIIQFRNIGVKWHMHIRLPVE